MQATARGEALTSVPPGLSLRHTTDKTNQCHCGRPSTHLGPPTSCPTPPIPTPLRRINNAGTNAYSYRPLTESTDEDLQEIVTTNVLGIMLCCREVRGGAGLIFGAAEPGARVGV